MALLQLGISKMYRKYSDLNKGVETGQKRTAPSLQVVSDQVTVSSKLYPSKVRSTVDRSETSASRSVTLTLIPRLPPVLTLIPAGSSPIASLTVRHTNRRTESTRSSGLKILPTAVTGMLSTMK